MDGAEIGILRGFCFRLFSFVAVCFQFDYCQIMVSDFALDYGIMIV